MLQLVDNYPRRLHPLENDKLKHIGHIGHIGHEEQHGNFA